MSMGNWQKQLGTSTESAVVTWFRDRSHSFWKHAQRLALRGAKDEGDVTLGDGIPVVIEVKGLRGSTSTVNLGGFVKELDAEIINRGAETGVIIIKRKGTTDVGEYYALTTVKHWEVLAAHKYGRRVVTRRRMG
jgi:hypothetical protein